MHISCAYFSAIDTRMKINFGQVWRPEADYNSSYAWTSGSAHKQKFRVCLVVRKFKIHVFS